MLIKSFLLLALSTFVFADDLMDGFDDDSAPEVVVQEVTQRALEGKITAGVEYSPHAKKPHETQSSRKISLFLEYNKALTHELKLKINAKAYHDFVYDKQGDSYTADEKKAFRNEIELYDFFIQGALSENLDMKLGRQVVVWGKSDTIRITDMLNPLDFRKPAMVDIEDLRLPVVMAKFDYYVDNWHISPVVIAEQRLSKNPPFGSVFYPSPTKIPLQEAPNDTTYALNIGGEFSGFDADFYAAHIYPQDTFGLPQINLREKINMFGASVNYVRGSWLFKSELASLHDLVYKTHGAQTFNRDDVLVGFEYNGLTDTKLSFDTSVRHFHTSASDIQTNYYQSAFRANKDMLNATLHANYLLTLNGKKVDEGGFQRVWFKYDIQDALSVSVGMVDYIGGSTGLDKIKENDIVFAEVSYSF